MRRADRGRGTHGDPLSNGVLIEQGGFWRTLYQPQKEGQGNGGGGAHKGSNVRDLSEQASLAVSLLFCLDSLEVNRSLIDLVDSAAVEMRLFTKMSAKV